MRFPIVSSNVLAMEVVLVAPLIQLVLHAFYNGQEDLERGSNNIVAESHEGFQNSVRCFLGSVSWVKVWVYSVHGVSSAAHSGHGDRELGATMVQ